MDILDGSGLRIIYSLRHASKSMVLPFKQAGIGGIGEQREQIHAGRGDDRKLDEGEKADSRKKKTDLLDDQELEMRAQAVTRATRLCRGIIQVQIAAGLCA